jgi:hypothetical protein
MEDESATSDAKLFQEKEVSTIEAAAENQEQELSLLQRYG